MPKPVRKQAGGFMNALLNALDADSKAQIEEAARLAHPKEACGFIIKPHGKRRMAVMECENKSAEPKEHFRISNFDEAEDAGVILAVWHSHPNKRPDPSPMDKTMAEENELPLLIIGWPNRQWASYEPNGWRAPLIGRPFAHGVLDCFAIMRDCLRWPDMRTWAGADQTTKIEIPDFDREDDWWLPLKWLPDGRKIRTKEPGQELAPPLNLYVENVERAGFVKVDDLKVFDVILTNLCSSVANHSMIYIGDGMILHHVQDRLSALQPYVIDKGYYSRHHFGTYRHRSLL